MRNLGILFTAALAFSLSTSQAWSKAHDPRALVTVLDRVTDAARTGTRPLVVFDLDDTLINTRARNLRILSAFIASPAIQSAYPNETRLVRGLGLGNVRYLLTDTLREAGVVDQEFVAKASAFWAKRFFTNEEVGHDVEIEDGARYVQALEKAGAKIIYLTGRDSARMEQGTLKSLRAGRFPVETALLLMKPDPKMDDFDFKRDSLASIRAIGEVVAVFENEPANLNLLAREFPSSVAVFLDTQHSPKPDVPVESASWIADFQAERSVRDKAKLASVIDVMGDIASEDGHMEAFFYKEALSDLRNPKCESVSAKDVVRELARAIRDMDPAGTRIAREDAALALTQFSELLGQGPFTKCESSFSESRSFTVLKQYVSRGYSFELEWGYED